MKVPVNDSALTQCNNLGAKPSQRVANQFAQPGNSRNRAESTAASQAVNRRSALAWCGCVAAILLVGCSAAQHKRGADKETYRIIESGQTNALGRKTDFNIDTPYSQRKPADLKPDEIINDRSQLGKKFLTVDDALQAGVANARTYQFRKETLYLTALTLTRERYEFSPQFFASSTAAINRNTDHTQTRTLDSQGGVDQLLKSGARLSAVLANDVVAYYVGNKPRSVVSTMSLNLVQPLLRGAGASIVAENLTQAERNVIYEVRNFDRFQTTFAVDVVVAYLRLLQQKDTVRNQYANYQSSALSSDRMEALSVDRAQRVQVDQARQKELTDRNSYLTAVDRYRDATDNFKQLLGLPLKVDLQLDDRAIAELKTNGLPPLEIAEEDAFRLALSKRLDLVNEIDRFEDAKRKIKVSADGLKTSLDFFANASIDSDRPTDYTKFTWDNYRASAGLRLNLPLDKLPERNLYRTSFINFERQLRTLAQSLDDLRDTLRASLRQLDLVRTSFDIQRRSVELADQRVESAELLQQAGRIQIRDLLEAQNDQLRARLAFTQALIDYYVARMGLLRDLGVLDIGQEKFWVRAQLPAAGGVPVEAPIQVKPGEKPITPDQLFGSKND